MGPLGFALVATDISTETKTVLPRMARLYWANWNAVDPALFVRASMAIPYFFEPLRVRDLPRRPELKEELAGYDGDSPTEVAFADGGVLSNFPIRLFHD